MPFFMTINALLAEATRKLRESGVETPRLDAEVLLSEVLKKDRVFLYTYPETELNAGEISLFLSMLDERIKRKPVSYIINRREFMGLNFFVNEDVLIPRPDTEILVESVLEELGETDSVLDLCTGSGAIGLSLKHFKPKIDLTLSDVSCRALEVARKNAERLGLQAAFIKSDLFEKIKTKYDVIVSNPPYIISREIEELAPEIRDWEPRLALDGGQDGYYFYQLIISEARAHLKRGGSLFLESGDRQSAKLVKLFKSSGFHSVGTKKDFSDNTRVVYGYVD